jgi:hypothetical protein
MKTSSLSQSANSVLLDVKEAEFELESLNNGLIGLNERIEQYDSDDPEKLQSLKLLATTRLKYARDHTRVALMKAKYGIVGNSWYNDGTDRQHKP